MTGLPPPFGSPPTARELQVLRMYLDTGSVRETARRLEVSESAVRYFMANLRSRTGARTTAEVVFLLYRELVA